MSDPIMVAEYPDESQRYAVCQSQLEGKSPDSRKAVHR